MAFPIVAAVNGGNDASGTGHTVNLPSGIEVGNLLLVFFASDSNPTITFPEGWTVLFNQTSYGLVRFGCWYRIAESTEGATIIVTTSNDQGTAHTSYRITDYSGTPEVATPTPGYDANPNPPNLTPSWGAEDTLWIAAEGNDRRGVTAYPTNYTNGRSDGPGGIVGATVGTARRELNAISENPGTFTIDYPDEWVANTVAIEPAPPPPPAIPRSPAYGLDPMIF